MMRLDNYLEPRRRRRTHIEISLVRCWKGSFANPSYRETGSLPIYSVPEDRATETTMTSPETLEEGLEAFLLSFDDVAAVHRKLPLPASQRFESCAGFNIGPLVRQVQLPESRTDKSDPSFWGAVQRRRGSFFITPHSSTRLPPLAYTYYPVTHDGFSR